MVLQAVISQQLVPTVDGKQVPVFEIMAITPAIRNMIRDNKVPQIDGVVYSSNKEEMHSMDFGLLNLYKEGRITAETALSYAFKSGNAEEKAIEKHNRKGLRMKQSLPVYRQCFKI